MERYSTKYVITQNVYLSDIYLFKQNSTLAKRITPIMRPRATPKAVTIKIPGTIWNHMNTNNKFYKLFNERILKKQENEH